MAASLASMTGYGRATGALPGIAFTVELKSVNGRGLDMRMRMSSGLEALEGEIRRTIGKSITRGSLNVSINLDREGEGGRVVVNHQALEAILDGFKWLETRVAAEPPSLDGIMGLRGVLEQHEAALSPEDEEALNAAVLDGVERAVAALAAARRDEGARIAAILNERIDEIAALTKAAELHPGRGRDAILAKLRQQVAELSEASPTLSEERLAQEAVLLATKADIREELDRLTAHVAGGGPVGRKLDFLSQEFNREANTLCSKSNDVALTAIGLDLKAVIDQLREQVQNIE